MKKRITKIKTPWSAWWRSDIVAAEKQRAKRVIRANKERLAESRVYFVLHPAAGVVEPLRIVARTPDAAALRYARKAFGREAVVSRYAGYSYGPHGSYFTTSVQKRNGQCIPAGRAGCTDEDLGTEEAFLKGALQVWRHHAWNDLCYGRIPPHSAPWGIHQLNWKAHGHEDWTEATKGRKWILAVPRKLIYPQ